MGKGETLAKSKASLDYLSTARIQKIKPGGRKIRKEYAGGGRSRSCLGHLSTESEAEKDSRSFDGSSGGSIPTELSQLVISIRI